ncbi:MAG TPA: hypothetical protein VJ306_09665, partial [Pyrinomonadaceae bacterium]|nr:hypothetical protein [Pyrinomonadaceae bacterium]
MVCFEPQILKNIRAVSFFGAIAVGLGYHFQKSLKRGIEAQLLHQVNHARGVTHNLNRLDPSQIRKEPPATRKHQQRTSLH